MKSINFRWIQLITGSPARKCVLYLIVCKILRLLLLGPTAPMQQSFWLFQNKSPQFYLLKWIATELCEPNPLPGWVPPARSWTPTASTAVKQTSCLGSIACKFNVWRSPPNASDTTDSLHGIVLHSRIAYIRQSDPTPVEDKGFFAIGPSGGLSLLAGLSLRQAIIMLNYW